MAIVLIGLYVLGWMHTYSRLNVFLYVANILYASVFVRERGRTGSHFLFNFVHFTGGGISATYARVYVCVRVCMVGAPARFGRL